jgi:hypothetical protein
VRLRRGLFLLFVGCSSPITVAQLRDGGADGNAEAPDPVAPGAPPTFGEASLSDGTEDGPPIDDPPEDATSPSD